MPERDYSNNWEDWVRDNPFEYQGRPEQPQGPPPLPTAPLPYAGSPPGNNQWGISIPSENVGNGMDRDLAYWLQHGVTPQGNDQSIFDANGQLRPGWKRTARGYERVGGGETTITPTTGGPTTSGGETNPFTFSDYTGPEGGYAWPEFNAPQFSYENYTAPNPFVFEKFNAPSLEEAEQEPGYAFAKKEGERSLMANKSAMGTLRSSGTIKDMLGWYNGFAEQNYGNAFNRKLGVHRENEGNRFQAYNTNEGNRFNTWNANKGLALDTFDRTYKGAWDTFSSKDSQRKFELNDAYNHWLAKLNSATQLAQPPG